MEHFQSHTKKLVEIALEFLSSDMANMQYIALTTINRLYDLYVYHNLINPGRYHACYIPLSRRQLHLQTISSVDESARVPSPADQRTKASKISTLLRRFSREQEEKSRVGHPKGSSASSLTSAANRDLPKRWIPLYSTDNVNPNAFVASPSSATLIAGGAAKENSTESIHPPASQIHLINAQTRRTTTLPTDLSNPIYTYEPFALLYQIDPEQFLRLIRTRLDAHRTEFHNRPKCVPSTRSPVCTHHCVVILAARILAILAQDHTFQLKLIGSKENLGIIVDMLNINNDPVRRDPSLLVTTCLSFVSASDLFGFANVRNHRPESRLARHPHPG